VVDATNVQPESRKPLVEIAREFHCLPVAIVLDVPEARGARPGTRPRADRDFGAHVIASSAAVASLIARTGTEAIPHVHVLKSLEEVEAAVIERQPLWNNLKHEHGPFDIIGDVHGCFDELIELLQILDMRVRAPRVSPTIRHPDGRKLVFVGDLVDRGRRFHRYSRSVMSAVSRGVALCCGQSRHEAHAQAARSRSSNHARLANPWRNSPMNRRISQTRCGFIDDLVSHYVLDHGKLVVAHAGMKEDDAGSWFWRGARISIVWRDNRRGQMNSLTRAFNWAAQNIAVSQRSWYGNTACAEPEWLNRTINIDTGCVFGGS